MCSQEEFVRDMEKLESKLDKIECEIKVKKQRKFQRDLVDYERGQILTFSRRYDQLRSKAVIDIGTTSSKVPEANETDECSSVDSMTSGSGMSTTSEMTGLSKSDKILKEYNLMAQGRFPANARGSFPKRGKGNRGGRGAGSQAQYENTGSPVGSRTRGQIQKK